MALLEKKLERPPYVHNWIRNVGPDHQTTVKRLVKTATSILTQTYGGATPIIFDRIVSGLERETALKAALTTGRVNSRAIVADYVEAFLDYDEVRNYSGRRTFEATVEPFRLGKGLTVPVKPLVNIVENGKLVPIFSVGWSSIPFNDFQWRLLSTVLEDAVFSLSDFRTSPSEFLFFPRDGTDKSSKRRPLIWNRGDFELIGKAEMTDFLDMYLGALEEAKQILRSMPAPEKPERRGPSTQDINQLGFDI